MADRITGKVAVVVANEGIEQVELTESWKALEDAGAQPTLIAPSGGQAQAMNHFDKADTFPVDLPVADADPDEYIGLMLPGGVGNPDILRMDADAVAFVRAFFDAGKPVAAICHAPWTLIEADVVRGRTMTSWPSVKTDLVNAGANWVDDEVVECSRGPNTLVTSRKPDDLPAFCRTLVETFAESA